MAKAVTYYGTGRRKSSVARVFMTPGKGNITVNGKSLDEYFGLETLKRIVLQPLAATGTADQFDVKVTVKGGGTTGQAGAVRHGIARALNESLQTDPEERGIPHQRFPHEGKKEVRPQSRTPRTAVLKEIIWRVGYLKALEIQHFQGFFICILNEKIYACRFDYLHKKSLILMQKGDLIMHIYAYI